ncbi:SRPBCC domain-containing protein [Sinosporangium siamense]|uniref:Activator of Hsp90 ATPase homologue 1/2-like C-terminal domain-containing protein n=1 Tax=Sinosporangium siamense TaxID=1367973 RepID=A0A919RHB1_9ACTN|nr:SRPBCC domain-containing protein [Sinosporangium siamense]GII93342.1 hypothetical protein Ssi02_35730 [Sinosporangium siamense]
MPIPDRIERTLTLAHPQKKVWDALTTEEGLNGWFGDRVEAYDLRPGGQIDMRWGDELSTLWIKLVEPPHRFAFTWAITGLPADDPRRTYIEFTLEPDGDNTKLNVVESGFAQLPDEMLSAFTGNTEGWQKELSDLVIYLDASD